MDRPLPSRSPFLGRAGFPVYMSVVTTPKEAPWKAGLHSARANLAPGLVLQAFALAVVLGYYFHGPTRDALSALGDLRNDAGAAFGIVSTGLFGGLLPLLFLKASVTTRARVSWTQGLALTVFWAYKGFEIDLWYTVMARMFGSSVSVETIALKGLTDQFVYCPLWAIPSTAVAYLWCKTGFNTRAVFDDFRIPRWYARRVLPLLFANLGVWLPLVCIIYALPTPLQLPLQNIVLCFFTLMLAHMSQRETVQKPRE